MNIRQKNIIRELINFENNTIVNLATMLAVSYRTVQNDIQTINAEIKKYGVQIVSSTNKGIFVETNDQRILEQLLLSLEENDYDNIELTYQILKIFVDTENYIKIDELMQQFFVSKKVINNCLNNIKKILSEYNLKIISKPAYGSKIVGLDGLSEAKIRRLILETLKKQKSFYLPGINEQQQEQIIEAIKKRCIDHTYITTEESLNDLICGIFIAITRIKQHRYIDYDQSLVAYLTELDEYETAVLIADDISKITYLQYEVREIAYIARIMKAHRRLTVYDMEKLENNIRADLDCLITDILDAIENKYHLDLHNDLDLYISLGMHLVPLISRIRFNFHINNPLVKEVKRNYMLAFDMAATAAEIIENKFDIELSEDEIGYLAVHLNLAIERKNSNVDPKSILIVCSSGGGLSKLLEFKVRNNFAKRIKYTKTCNMYELKDLDLTDFDYVLTTVKLDYQLSKPTLQISHMLTDKDVDNFNIVLNTDDRKNRSLVDIAKEEYFFNDIRVSNKEEAIDQIVSRLQEKLPLQDDFIKQVFEREKLYSTEIGNGVAFPHPLETRTAVSFISVCILKKPIKWENEKVQVIMVANTKVGESEKLQLMYRQFAYFVSEKQNIIDLVKNPTYETFKKLVERKN